MRAFKVIAYTKRLTNTDAEVCCGKGLDGEVWLHFANDLGRITALEVCALDVSVLE